MRHIPYLVCVLCVQEKADCQSKLAKLYTYTQHILAQPSITEQRRAVLEKRVRDHEDRIQRHKQCIAMYNSDLARAEGELAELGEFINNIDTLITQLIIMQDNMQDKLETNNNSLRVYICMYVCIWVGE